VTGALRSEGWKVHPTFVPNGENSPVTLLSDESGLTQLAGDPAVAWQTPWSELSSLQLTRFARGLALFATVDGVRYCWRNASLVDYEALEGLVLAHGGTVSRYRRRAGMVAVALAVLLASLAGGLGAWLNRDNAVTHELAAAQAVNLTLKDLPAEWSVSPPSVLSYLFTSSTQLVTATTAPPISSSWSRISTLFQRCLGVSASRDRVYGAAGQLPDYQVSSPVFTSLNGDVVLASTTQYYNTTAMVSHDVAEMSKKDFGSCFATSNAAVLFTMSGAALPTSNIGTNWNPVTFVHGFVRGGVAKLSAGGPSEYLVVVTTATAHFEVTLGAMVSSWPGSEATIAALVNTLLARTTSTTSTAA
jgi:hypothetical protein